MSLKILKFCTRNIYRTENEQNEQICGKHITQDQNHLNDRQEPFTHWVTKKVFEGLASFSVGRAHWSKEGKKKVTYTLPKPNCYHST